MFGIFVQTEFLMDLEIKSYLLQDEMGELKTFFYLVVKVLIFELDKYSLLCLFYDDLHQVKL